MDIRHFLLSLFVLAAGLATGQSTSISPYSQFGIGDLHRMGNTSVYGFGGITSVFSDGYNINPANPASYAYLNQTTLQVGTRASFLQLDNGSATQELNLSHLNHAYVALKPTGANWGLTLGISPYSSTGYESSILRNQEIEGNTADINDNYLGNGGISQGFIGFGRSFESQNYVFFKDPFNNIVDSLRYSKHSLALGVNGSYFFGVIEEERSIDFQDPNFLDTRITSRNKMKGFGADIGLQYTYILKQNYDQDKKLRERWSLSAGVSYTPEMSWNTSLKELGETTQEFSLVSFPIDTTYIINGTGTTSIPQRLATGFSVRYQGKKGREVTLAAEIRNQEWSTSERNIDGVLFNPQLANFTESSLGIKFVPKSIQDAKNFLGRSHYYFGVRTAETYLQLDSYQLQDEAFTFAINIPMLASKSISRFNFGMELGTRGTTENNLLRENYLNLQIGVSLSPYFKNAWFRQRKYD
jgi:hypothetical protein